MAGEPSIVVTLGQDGEYTVAFVALVQRASSDSVVLEGKGISRTREKAISYALEDLAVKVRNGG